MNKTSEKGFEQIASGEFMKVSLHRELAGGRHGLSKQKLRTGFWEEWAGAFKSPCVNMDKDFGLN